MYAKRILDDLFSLLPAYDLATISGGAEGVDMYVHESSLSHSIPTAVVLG
jgi:predicted Rossmann fold nucleotide-binding protein DprA/Smf involved in DNA uptake